MHRVDLKYYDALTVKYAIFFTVGKSRLLLCLNIEALINQQENPTIIEKSKSGPSSFGDLWISL